jgi:hypothetical protein
MEPLEATQLLALTYMLMVVVLVEGVTALKFLAVVAVVVEVLVL